MYILIILLLLVLIHKLYELMHPIYNQIDKYHIIEHWMLNIIDNFAPNNLYKYHLY